MKLGNLSAIIADDSKTARAILMEMLRGIGMRDVRQTSDGAEAFAEVCVRAPHVLILDFDMPYDGLKTLQLVRRSPKSPNPRLPVIMITGLTTRERIVAMRDAGTDEIVAKPLSAAKVLSRIEAAMTNQRPFVTSPGYVGPDRRRADLPQYRGPFRRAADRRRSAPADVFEI